MSNPFFSSMCIYHHMLVAITNDTTIFVPVFIPHEDEDYFGTYAVIPVLYTVEMLAIAACFPLTYVFMTAMSRTALFHWNLRCITQAHIFICCLGFLGRIVLFLYEIDLLNYNDRFSLKIVLSVAALFRLWFLLAPISFVQCVVIERIFATFFISDYEARRRSWISSTLLVLSIPASLIAVLAFLLMIPGALAILIACIMTVLISVVIAAILYRRNLLKLRNIRGSSIVPAANYTLGIKFQLVENLRTMKVVMINILLTTALVACGLVLIVLIFITFCDLPMKAHLCFVLLDLLVAVSAVAALMFCTHVLGEWRRIVQRCPSLQRQLGRVFSSLKSDSFFQNVRDPNKISQQYFNQLNKTWETM